MDTVSLVKERKMMSDGWLRCNIVKGMFSDELAIVYSFKAQGKEASFFVPKDQVVGAVDSEGKVKVRFYRQGDTSWAVLPTDYQTAIPVDEADLIINLGPIPILLRPGTPICQLIVEQVDGVPFGNDSQFQNQSRPGGHEP